MIDSEYNFHWKILRNFNSDDYGMDFLAGLNLERKNSGIKIRFLADEKINLIDIIKSKKKINPSLFKRVIFHVHGGGFIAMSSSSHEIYLRKFVKRTECVVFSVDYPLAP